MKFFSVYLPDLSKTIKLFRIQVKSILLAKCLIFIFTDSSTLYLYIYIYIYTYNITPPRKTLIMQLASSSEVDTEKNSEKYHEFRNMFQNPLSSSF